MMLRSRQNSLSFSLGVGLLALACSSALASNPEILSVTLNGDTTTTVPSGDAVEICVTVLLHDSTTRDWDGTALWVNGQFLCVNTPNHDGPQTVTECFYVDLDEDFAPEICGIVDVKVRTNSDSNCGSILYMSNEVEIVNGITVHDDEDPVVVCKDITVYLDENGEASINPQHVLDHATDNCGVTNLVSVEPNTFDCTNLGENTVVLTVEDEAAPFPFANQATCESIVTVADNLAPIVNCENIEVCNDAGECGATLAIELPDVTENCECIERIQHCFAGVNLQDGEDMPCENWVDGAPPEQLYPVGRTFIKWRARDCQGNNSEPCVQRVIVNDCEIPNISCANPDPVLVAGQDCCAYVNVAIPQFGDNCDIDRVTHTTVLPNGRPGHCNDECLATGGCDSDGGCKGAHSCNEDASGPYPIGCSIVTFTVYDVNGNFNTCEVSVCVETNTPPFIKCGLDACFFVSDSDPSPPVGDNNRCYVYIDFEDQYLPLNPYINDPCVDDKYLTVTHTAIGPDGQVGPFPDFGGQGAGCFDGPNCWDLNGNGVGDIPGGPGTGEDANGDGVVDNDDCLDENNNPVKHPMNCDDNASGYYPVGQTIIEWTVYNEITGLSSTCTQTINVVDDIDPWLPCSAVAFAVETSDGSCDSICVDEVLEQILSDEHAPGPFSGRHDNCAATPSDPPPLPPYPPFGDGNYNQLCPEVEVVVVECDSEGHPIFNEDGTPVVATNKCWDLGVNWITFIARDCARDCNNEYAPNYSEPCSIPVLVILGPDCEGQVITGACCMSDGTCADLPESACDSAGGSYFDGVACADKTCPPPGSPSQSEPPPADDPDPIPDPDPQGGSDPQGDSGSQGDTGSQGDSESENDDSGSQNNPNPPDDNGSQGIPPPQPQSTGTGLFGCGAGATSSAASLMLFGLIAISFRGRRRR